MKEIYLSIDRDANGTVDKEEMVKFLKILLSDLQKNIRKNKESNYKFLKKLQCPETDVSRDIRVTAEVEKIWIVHDVDKNGTLDFEEVKEYIKGTAFSSMDLTDYQVEEIYGTIDKDGNGSVDREEMAQFLNLLLILQDNQDAQKELKRQEKEAKKLLKAKRRLMGRTSSKNLEKYK